MFIAKRAPILPLYSTLTNPEVIIDATGLRYNTTNAYGTVSSVGGVGQIRSITPAPTDRFFAPIVATPTTSGSVKLIDGFIDFHGGTVFESTDLAGEYDFMSFASPATNVKYTVHMVLKVGIHDIPNLAYGFFGNNGGSTANRGISISYDDRILVPNSDGINALLSAGGGTTIINSSPDDLIVPNVPFVYTVEVDLSQAAANRMKHYINGVQFTHSATSPGTVVVTGPFSPLGIGSTGNAARPFAGWMSHIIIQSAIESSGVRNAFVQSLIPYTRQRANYFFNVDQSIVFSTYNTYNPTGRYFFGGGVSRSPITGAIIETHHNGDQHVYAADKYVGFRKSLDVARTWGSPGVAIDYDTTGPYAVQSHESGYSADGRFHILSDFHTIIATAGGGSHVLLYTYSDDDGSNWTTVDITASLPANGLTMFRAHGAIKENNGYLYATLYMQTAEDSNTDTAVYCMRKPIGSSTTWSFFLVASSPSATLYLNEAYIEPLDDSTLLCLIRNETSKEYSMSRGTSDGSSWTALEDASFGETYGVGTPPLMSSFYFTNEITKVRTKIIAVWTANRSSNPRNVKVIYGTATAIAASGYAGFDLDTKTTVYSVAFLTLHYGGICHPYEDMQAIGVFAQEPNPATTLENILLTSHMPTTQYDLVRAELAL